MHQGAFDRGLELEFPRGGPIGRQKRIGVDTDIPNPRHPPGFFQPAGFQADAAGEVQTIVAVVQRKSLGRQPGPIGPTQHVQVAEKDAVAFTVLKYAYRDTFQRLEAQPDLPARVERAVRRHRLDAG